MATPPVTVAQFKAQFNRDWPYGPGKDAVMDSDINKAMNEALLNYSAALFGDDASGYAFMYLSAHYLWLNLQAAGGLSAKGTGKGLSIHGQGTIASKGADGLSVAYAIPERVAKSPILNQFMQSFYGQKYLAMLAPRLVGGVFTVAGPRDPQATVPPLIAESL